MALGRSTKDDHVAPSAAVPQDADQEGWESNDDPGAREHERAEADPLLDTVSMDALPPVDAEDTGPGSAPEEENLPLLDDRQADEFLDRWSRVQAQFVDDPKAAVRDGDSLVTEVMQALSDRLAQQKGDLEAQWQRGDEPHTEDLRLALQQYRSFFQRLLAT